MIPDYVDSISYFVHLRSVIDDVELDQLLFAVPFEFLYYKQPNIQVTHEKLVPMRKQKHNCYIQKKVDLATKCLRRSYFPLNLNQRLNLLVDM
ncbi:unnamed protein product [Schistosoma curassoni]|uniref:Exostosin domain-containing protein n=1 Tax=Schistosoma curassoni TaxID=6186 RepID=A0A183KL27_9TREM|nr:unnamed protein product [Schistosoma curassoni]